MLGHTLAVLAKTLTNTNQKTKTMKHITIQSYDKGHAFDGYRVAMQKKGITFCKYFSIKDSSWEEAEKHAIECEEYLSQMLNACNTQNEVIKFYLEWRKK